jgi:hypothetical protein
MSIKTLRKRIALVAVSALGVGLLSVAPASAADGDITVSTASNTGSYGILVSLAGTAGSSDQTITISDNGQLTLTLDSSTTGAMTVSGPCIFRASTLASYVTVAATTISGTGKRVSNTTDANTFAVLVPTGGAGTCVVNAYENSTEEAAGTVEDKLVVTVALGSTVNVYDASKSFFSVETSAQAADSNVDASYTGASGAGTFAGTTVINGGTGYFGYYAKDSQSVALSSKSFSATTTGPCIIGAGATAGSYSTASTTTNNSYFTVKQAVANSPASCPVTISIDGVAVASRTFTIQGQVESIKVVYGPVRVKATSAAANAAAVYLLAYDKADNAIDNVALSPVTTYYNAAFTTITSITTSPNSTSATANSADITCVAKGAQKTQFSTTNASSVSIKSPVIDFFCAGNAVTYTASLDKASYVPGDIATLTITGKDSAGNLTHDYETLGTGSTSAPSIAGSNMTAVTAATSADTFTNGVKKYKFVVGSTEGNYQMVVDLPDFNDPTTPQAAVTVAYSIKAPSTGAVTNAEVLAAIVKLIASINKQIAQLQKQLKKK